MKKEIVVIVCLFLLSWFLLDMTGLWIGEKYLVTQSYKEDGIFFIIYLIALIMFIYKEKVGKYILDIWLMVWLITQFMSHWYFTIMGGGSGKIEYFKGSIKLLNDPMRYIPDFYHIILHVFIILSLVVLNLYIFKTFRAKNTR